MKFRLLFGVAASALLLNACKEIGPAIDLHPKDLSERDTSYFETGTVAPQPRKVLIEEYTGVQCPNCPAGAQILKNYDEAHPGKIVVVALHSGALTNPIPGESKYNFAVPDVQNFINNYLGGETPPKPAASIDRVDHGSGYGFFIVNKNQWTSYIDQRLLVASPVNLTLNSEWDSVLQKVIIKVKIVYTQTVTKKQNLSLWVMESGIVDAQLNETEHIPDYVHNHVFRDFITPLSGSRILDSVATKTSGLVLERRLVYTPKFLGDSKLDKWNLGNCKIVAVVHNDEQGDKEVAQAAETELK